MSKYPLANAPTIEPTLTALLSPVCTIRGYGGRFTLLMHDLWGADSKQGESFSWPGDNGDWTEHDAFLDTVFGDLKANDALKGLDIDIWNEPDITAFWNTAQEYLATWNHTWHRIREELPETVITGSSAASTPERSGQWWVDFMAYVSETNTIPDQWAWHLIDSATNARQSTAEPDFFADQYSFPTRPINMNEYGKAEGEQNPVGAVYFTEQLERANTAGLRANWASDKEFQDSCRTSS